jgi:CMP-N-acetylneuraminic acid synthetase
MKVVAMIPYWTDYHPAGDDPMQDRNLMKLGGRHPINYSLHALNLVNSIDEIVLYCSNQDILNSIDDQLEFEFKQRPEFLDSEDITIEDIIDEFLKVTDADVIVMLHPNSPFLQYTSISECIDKVLNSNYDSAFTAYEYKKLAWYKGSPLNYSLSEPIPQLENLEPVVFEQSSLYVFTRAVYLKQRKRVGSRPYLKKINHFEGHEINVKEDFRIAELIVNSGMYSEY